MVGLTLDQFLSAGPDLEGAQYRILDGLQQVRQAFSRNLIYPHLGELIKLYETLQTILKQLRGLKEALPGRVKGIDLEHGTLQYEKPEMGQMDMVEDLIRWAIPYLQEAIEEGRTIFEFVDEHLHLEEVGIVPSYVEEGYLLVPDMHSRRLHILQYTLSIFTRADERFRSLKTTQVKEIPQHTVLLAPQHVKLQLMAERSEMPNPATFFVDSRLDFPFEATVLPVAKRKLMRHLFTQQGLA